MIGDLLRGPCLNSVATGFGLWDVCPVRLAVSVGGRRGGNELALAVLLGSRQSSRTVATLSPARSQRNDDSALRHGRPRYRETQMARFGADRRRTGSTTTSWLSWSYAGTMTRSPRATVMSCRLGSPGCLLQVPPVQASLLVGEAECRLRRRRGSLECQGLRSAGGDSRRPMLLRSKGSWSSRRESVSWKSLGGRGGLQLWCCR